MSKESGNPQAPTRSRNRSGTGLTGKGFTRPPRPATAGRKGGEEEAGTLEFLLSLPISRTRVLMEKMAALAIEVVALGMVLFVALLIGTAATDMDIGAGGLAAASFDVVALAWLYGALAALLGAALGHRALAGGIAAALAVLAYVVNGLAPLVDAIDALRPYSPWYHYADSAALTSGLDPLNIGVLLAITAALVLLAPLPLRWRDIGV
ncbi:MAG: ABC transporter permease subunit [Miltoncostaeaceae bacterium]